METQRRQLIDFLKGCRARLSPAQVGLPDTNRRRTPGLRREDVAALAGVSVTWYTWLEQGRKIQVSADVLERVCTTLRMTPDEREYLFALVQHRPAPPAPVAHTQVSPTLAAHYRGARCADPRDDGALGRDRVEPPDDPGVSRLRRIPPEQRNLLRILLDERHYQHDPVAYETMVRRRVEVPRRLQPEPRRSGLRGADRTSSPSAARSSAAFGTALRWSVCPKPSRIIRSSAE